MSQKDIHRRFLHNAGLIVGSRVGFGLLNLGTNAIVLRSFSAGDLGMIMLLVAYIRVFAEVVKFDSWQAVLRFGVMPEESGDLDRLRRLVGLTLMIDLITMLTAIVASVLLIPYAAVWFGWNDQITRMAPWFMILIVFVTNATPNGVLRLFDRVEILAVQHGANAVIRMALVLLAIVMGGAVQHLALAWFAAFVISSSITMVVCAVELTRRGLLPVFSLKLRKTGRRFPGIWRFLLMSNLIGIGPLAVQHLTTLFVGAMLGPAQAAILALARQISSGASAPTRLLGPLLLPDFSRLAGHGDWAGLRDVLVKQLRVAALVALGLGAFLFTLLPLLIRLAFGAEMLEHIWLFRLFLVAALINVTGFSLQHALFSANKGGTALLIQLTAISIYVIVMLGGLWVIGLNAVGFAAIALAFSARGLTIFVGRRLLKKRIRKAKRRAAEGIAPEE